MVNEDAVWLGWMREAWAVVEAPTAEPQWVIIQRQDLGKARSIPHLGEYFQNEEVARHVARAHNYYLSGLKQEQARKELGDDGSEPSEP